MIDLKQKELNDWQARNFGNPTSENLALGMAEEVGELCHFLLKRHQHIREGLQDVTEDIGDAWSDCMIYGIQLMTSEGIDAEEMLGKTITKVLQRDWKKNPHSGEHV